MIRSLTLTNGLVYTVGGPLDDGPVTAITKNVLGYYVTGDCGDDWFVADHWVATVELYETAAA